MKRQPSNAATARRAPPFCRELVEVLRRPAAWPRFPGTSTDGRHLTLNVTAGAAAWTLARSLRECGWLVLVAPPDDHPKRFDWRALAGHDPILLHLAGALETGALHTLIAVLMRDGTRRIVTIRADRIGERFIARQAA